MEELTTKMHSEFSVNNDVELKHRCFCVLKRLQKKADKSSLLNMYNVTEDQVNSFKKEFELLSK